MITAETALSTGALLSGIRQEKGKHFIFTFQNIKKMDFSSFDILKYPVLPVQEGYSCWQD